jgi:two-component system cell cycle response regulator DivK
MMWSPGMTKSAGETMTEARERSLILIVEDVEDSREVYKEVLSENGFEVETAASAAEGLRLARASHPSAILMDISLPDMDGWNTTTQLKADPETWDIPVIIITAYAFPEDRVRAKRVGCDGFLTKPCEPSRVLAEIQRLLAG